MTATMQPPSRAYLFLIGFLIIALASTITVLPGQHAVERHGEDAVSVRKCINGSGASHMYWNPASNRFALLCQLENGLWGIQIAEQVNGEWKEVTAFVKNKFGPNLEKVIDYLTRTGYTIGK